MKKILSLVLALSLVMGSFGMAFADTTVDFTAEATFLNEQDVLKGNANGELNLDLNLTRQEAFLMVARLLGEEEEALNFMFPSGFDDADQAVWKWDNIAAWARGKGLTTGKPGNLFDFEGTITFQEVYTLMFRAMGKTVAWGEVMDSAIIYGIDVDGEAAAAITRAQLAGVVVNTLDAEEGKLATALGIVTPKMEAALEIESVSVVGVSKVKVTFNRALTEDVATELKRGYVKYNTTNTLSEDKTSMVLETEFRMYAGDYTVTVGEFAPVTVKVEAEKLASLAIDSNALKNEAGTELEIAALNQYGEAMDLNASAFTATAYNATAAQSVTEAALVLDLSNADKDDAIVVTVTHNATGMVATKTLKVIDASAYQSFAFGNIVLGEDEVRIETGDTFKVDYTLVDQYGEEVTLSTKDEISLISTNNNIVSTGAITLNSDKELVFVAGATAGTATITAVIPATGSTSTIKLEVVEPADVDTITVNPADKLVAAGDTVELTYTAVDQFGQLIEPADITTTAGITFASSNGTVVLPSSFAFDADNKLTFDALGEGTTTIYVYFNGTLQNSFVVNVEEARVATKITAVEDVETLLEASTTVSVTVDYDNLVVVDQYNDEFALTNEDINVSTGSALKAIAMSGNTFASGTSITITATTAAGVDALTFTIGNDDSSSYKVNFGTILTKDIASYELKAIDTLYATTDAAYDVTAELVGKDAKGTEVKLLPGKIAFWTTNDSSIATVSGTAISGLDAGEAVIAAWNADGDKLAETTVVVSDVAPVVTTATFDADGDLTVTDQYGVKLVDDVAYGLFSNASIGRIVETTETVKFISVNGVTALYTK